MSNNNPKHHRQSIRLPGYDYSSPGVYFVTMCLDERACLLGEIHGGKMRLSKYGVIADKWWRDIPQRFPGVVLDVYVIMPNHVHGLIIIEDNTNAGAIHELPLPRSTRRGQRRTMTLPKIIGYYKMNTAKQINQMRNISAHPVWQRNYYEHIMRDEQSIESVREYIRMNPDHWANDEENPGRNNCQISATCGCK